LKNKIKNLEEENENNKKKIFEQNKVITELQNNYDKLLLDFKQIEERNKNLEKENSELRDLLSNSEEKYNNLQNDY
jgi:predicted nuclease with TOPRIM domain